MLIVVIMVTVTQRLINVHVAMDGQERGVKFQTVLENQIVLTEDTAILPLILQFVLIVHKAGWDLDAESLVFMANRFRWIVEIVFVILDGSELDVTVNVLDTEV